MLVELRNINKSYKFSNSSNIRKVLNDIFLTINKGESLSIVGPSGSGKTTLLNMIGTLDQPDTGEILFNNQTTTSLKDKELSQFRNQKIGFIYQQHHLLPHLTLLENVLLPTLPQKDKANKEQKALELLKSIGLEKVIHQKPGQLSGGECQRTAVARALINKPEIVLADEPTGSLDAESATNIGQLLTEINKKEKITIIVVTHDQKLAALFQQQYVLNSGKLNKA